MSSSPATARQSSPPGWPAGRTRRVASAARSRQRGKPVTRSCGAGRGASLAEAHRAGTTTIEIKTGYGLSADDEHRLASIAAELTSEVDVPRRPRRARRVRRAGRRLRRPRDAARCSSAALRTPAGSTRSARPVHSPPSSAARCSRPGRGPGSACVSTPTSWVLARAFDSGSSWAAPPSTIAPTSATTTSARWPAVRPWRRSFRQPTSPLVSRTPTLDACSTPASRWPSRPTATRGRATRRRWRSASPSPCATSA